HAVVAPGIKDPHVYVFAVVFLRLADPDDGAAVVLPHVSHRALHVPERLGRAALLRHTGTSSDAIWSRRYGSTSDPGLHPSKRGVLRHRRQTSGGACGRQLDVKRGADALLRVKPTPAPVNVRDDAVYEAQADPVTGPVHVQAAKQVVAVRLGNAAPRVRHLH